MELMNAKSQHKLIVYGEYGAGKTTFGLSVIEYLRDTLKMQPSQCRICILDNDGGVMELVENGLVDEKWLPSVGYYLCQDWKTLTENTTKVIKELQDWQKKNGPMSAWLIVDNMHSSWQWCRNDFALQAYGMPEHELAEQKRNEAIASNKKMLPTFNQRADYGVITPKHAAWADTIKLSGVNFIWLAPESSWTAKDPETDQETTTIKAKGQGDNPGRVAHIIRLYTEGEGEHIKYMAMLEKNRGGTKLFNNMPNPTYKRFRLWVEQNSPLALAAKAAASPPKSAEVKA